MARRLITPLALALVMMAIASVPAWAQTPTPEPNDIELPTGWGPTDGIRIISHSGNVELLINTDTTEVICGEGIHLWRAHYFDPTGLIIPADPPAVVKLRVEQDYGDGYPGNWMLRLRFAYWINQNLAYEDPGYPVTHLEIDVLNQDENEIINTRLATYCPDGFFPGVDCDPVLPGNPEWRIFDSNLLVRDYSVIVITLNDSQFVNPLDPHYIGSIISSLYADRYSEPFPADFCGEIYKTPTPQATWTPWPTWTSTPTGTLTATPTLPPTAVGPSPTPSVTPAPFSTWTPSPSPTAWQSPMATLAFWNVTPDASVTPYLTPTAYNALPTWAPFPTVAYPTVVTRTPYPTSIWDPVTTTTPVATSTPYTLTVNIDQMFTDIDDVNTSINFAQVYSAAYSLSSRISTPLRVMRGVSRYFPNLSPILNAMIIGLFVVIAVISWGAIVSLVRALIRLIEFILEFIPL